MEKMGERLSLPREKESSAEADRKVLSARQAHQPQLVVSPGLTLVSPGVSWAQGEQWWQLQLGPSPGQLG